MATRPVGDARRQDLVRVGRGLEERRGSEHLRRGFGKRCFVIRCPGVFIESECNGTQLRSSLGSHRRNHVGIQSGGKKDAHWNISDQMMSYRIEQQAVKFTWS